MSGYVKTETHKGITSIEFFHPQSNSLPAKILRDLSVAIQHAGHDPATLVIILRSAGEKAFCAGASFDELLTIETLEAGQKFFSGFANVINAMRECPKIIVGRIHGKAVGGGVGLASACDYAMATQNSAIKLSEIAIGIGPFVIEPAVSRKIGKTALSEMTLTPNEWQSAGWAKEKGLYANVFETREQLDEAVIAFAQKMATYNPDALSELKKVLWEGTENWSTLLYERAAVSGKLVLSDLRRTP